MTRARALMRYVWEKKRKGWHGAWGLVSILIAATALNVHAYGQNAGPISGGPLVASQINTITVQNSAGTTLKRFASPFVFKCDATMTCSVSGNILTIASAGGTFPQTIANASHKWLNSYNAATGLFTQTQPDYSDLTGTPAVPTGTGFSHITAGVQDAAAKLVNLTASTDVAANQGTATTLYHGNAAGQGAFGAVVSADHNITPTSCTNQFVSGISATVAGTCSTVAYGQVSGTPQLAQTKAAVASNWFNSYDAATGLFTATRPAFTDISGTATAAQEPSTTVNSVVNDTNITGSIAAQVLTLGWAGTLAKARNLPTAVYTDQSNTYSAATIQTVDILLAKRFTNAPIFYPDAYAGTDMCDKIATLIASAEFIAVASSIIDARGFTGDQNCATSNPFATTHSTKWIFNPGLHVHLTRSAFTFGPATSSLIAAPAAPTLATATTGGSLAAATTYGVKVTLVNLSGETTPSAEATKLTGAGATNSITVTSPTVAFPAYTGAVAYNIYSATPVGSAWKLNNTSGPIALGTSYVIKTVGAGVIPPTTNLAANDQYEVDFGNSTWSLESNTALILAAVNNTYFHDLTLINSTTLDNGVANAYVNSNISHVVFERITSGGGRIGFAINNGDTDIRFSNLRWGNPTFGGGGQAGIYITSGGGTTPSNIVVDGFELLPSVFNTTSGISAGVETNPCNDCTIQRIRCTNVDMSLSSFGGCVEIAGNNSSTTGSTNINVNNILCDSLIWADCVAVTGFSSGVNIDNVIAKNSNAVLGINGLNTFQQGDCVDIYTAAKVNVTNVHCLSMNTLNHTLPSIEIYESSEVSVEDVQSLDSGSGTVVFGSPSTHFSNFTANRNWNSGMDFKDETAVVTCNGTTALVWVSGNVFGPWNAGTAITIAGTTFNTSSVQDTTHLTLMTACALGASQAFILPTTDVSITSPKGDDNGQNGTGTGARTGTAEGIVVRDHSQITVIGGSLNDNQPVAANKHQQYGIRVTGTTARARVIGTDTTNNAGGTACGLEYGANVAGNHGICDDAKLSAITIDDNAGEILQSSNFKRVTADVTNATTTFATITSLTFNAAASFNYKIECDLIWQTNTLATGGLKLQVIGPAGTTNVLLQSEIFSHTSANSGNAVGVNVANATALTTALNGNAATVAANTSYKARLYGVLENGATAGLVSVQFAEQGAGTATIKRGSACSFDGVH